MRQPDLPPILALCGPAGVGKSTLARAVARLAHMIKLDVEVGRKPSAYSDQHDIVDVRTLRFLTEGAVVSLASPLKAMLRTLGVPEENLTGSLEYKEEPLDLLCGRSARHAMRTLGTEWGRDLIHPEIWLRAWQHAAGIAASAGGCPSLILVDDLRFDNERVFLQRLGGVVIRLLRPGVAYEADHPSERGPATYDAGVELRPYPFMTDDRLRQRVDEENAAAILRAAVTAGLKVARNGRGFPGPETETHPWQRMIDILIESQKCT